MDLTYITAPTGTDHLERPSGSEGRGDAFAEVMRGMRGRQTYCGRPIGDWPTTSEPTKPCASCIRAEFADDE